jgi:hypothetical protein
MAVNGVIYDSNMLALFAIYLNSKDKKVLCSTNKQININSYLVKQQITFKTQIKCVRRISNYDGQYITPLVASNIISIWINCSTITDETIIKIYSNYINLVNIKCVWCINKSNILLKLTNKSRFHTGFDIKKMINNTALCFEQNINIFTKKNLIKLQCLPKLEYFCCERLNDYDYENIVELFNNRPK